MRIIVLASGGLGASCVEDILRDTLIDFLATDSKSEAIIQIAEKNSIPYFKGNPREGRIVEALGDLHFDLLLSINYLFLIEEDLISKASIAINFHGSLLPKYRGRTPHVWAIINGEKQTGITAHKIDSGCDTGDIVKQVVVPIDLEDTGAIILEKYNALYPELISNIITECKAGSLTLVPQDSSKATYFGKRTHEDGMIDWSWQKERIRNWVRAQAHPYPGAFTQLNGTRITIDKVTYVDFGFEDKYPNGLVLAVAPRVLVKTPNGVVELTQIRNEHQLRFKVGQILGE